MYSVVNHPRHSLIKFSILLISWSLAGFVTSAIAGEAIEQANRQAINPASFVVTAQDGLITVNANGAPLKDVIERIGQELGIEVDAQIGDDEKVTAQFRDLSLEAALKRLSGNYAYTTDKQGEEITKLFLFAKGENSPSSGVDIRDAGPSKTGRRAGSSEPFKFEFDPMEAMGKEK